MTLFYDLTELYTASSKFHFYGIARVVAEVAAALQEAKADVTYVVYSPAKRGFYEVTPRFHDGASGFTVDLGDIAKTRPIRLRQTFHRSPLLGRALMPAYRAAIRAFDLHAWNRTAPANREVDLADGVLVSAARPKIIVEYLEVLKTRHPKARFMPWLHDMIPIHHCTRVEEIQSKRPFDRNFYDDNRAIIRAAERIITNSEFTKADIQRLAGLGLLPELPPMKAVPLAHECRGSQEAIREELPSPGYFLCVGATVGRKNLEVVINALLHLAKQGSTARLVLAGSSRKRVHRLLAEGRCAPIRDWVTTIDAPNQAELVELYQRAHGLVLASRLEGWGLPAGEALWWGTPAICADIPVLHEVCGAHGKYFHPDNAADLAANMAAILAVKPSAPLAGPRWTRSDLRTWADVAQDLVEAVE